MTMRRAERETLMTERLTADLQRSTGQFTTHQLAEDGGHLGNNRAESGQPRCTKKDARASDRSEREHSEGQNESGG